MKDYSNLKFYTNNCKANLILIKIIKVKVR